MANSDLRLFLVTDGLIASVFGSRRLLNALNVNVNVRNVGIHEGHGDHSVDQDLWRSLGKPYPFICVA